MNQNPIFNNKLMVEAKISDGVLTKFRVLSLQLYIFIGFENIEYD